MNEYKIQILQDQVRKIEEVLNVLRANFNIENEEEFANEYSFLSIVKENLLEYSNKPLIETSTKEQLAAISYVGKIIRIVKMEGEPNYNGKIGLVTKVDDKGQLHGTWQGSLAIQLDRDTIEIL